MILVTGASGFLGRHLLRFLSGKGYALRALYHQHPPAGDMKVLPGVEWRQCDLLDIYDVAEAMQGVTAVYHCAAMVSFGGKGDRAALQRMNVDATANVVNEALEQNVRKLVFVSSIAALGRAARAEKAVTEDEQWEDSNENSAYARSKYLAEMEVWRAIAEGLNAVVVNPAIILGEGNWDNGSPALIKVADKELPFYTEGVNGWVDVADVVLAMHLLMESDISSERFIISAGDFSYRYIFTEMAAALSRKAPHIKARPWMSGLLWRWNRLRRLCGSGGGTITRETAHTAHAICHYDNSRFLLRFPDFQYTPIENTIQHMAACFSAAR